jgi:hypothetical protein
VYHANEDPDDRLGRMKDALIESPTADDPTEVWGPPERWPAWTDTVSARLGRPLFPQERFDDLPDDVPDPEF